jgi:hypothetical protein
MVDLLTEYGVIVAVRGVLLLRDQLVSEGRTVLASATS